ncbi:MAG: hypothetical protein LBR10_15710 [Prevotellaceae bacterium]|jgi:hypothetical protein|nr:hypothetical protein [Prevotellaceae bacterium]
MAVTKIFEESGMTFDFSSCPPPEKCDNSVPRGLSSVDFFVETNDRILLIEVKNFENSHAPKTQRKADYEMLISSDTVFPDKIGSKIKDSLLRKYAEGHDFNKPIIAILILKQSQLMAAQRQRLYEKIIGHVPTGLNGYPKFLKILFDMPDITDTPTKYGFTVSNKNEI